MIFAAVFNDRMSLAAERNDSASTEGAVHFEVGSIEYSFDRGYLANAHLQGHGLTLARLRVTYPEFLPIDPSKAECLSHSIFSTEQGCRFLLFSIAPPQGVSHQEGLERLRDLIRSIDRSVSGFTIYSIGPAEDGLKIFRTTNGGASHVFFCNTFVCADGKTDAVCSGLERAASGALVEFMFPMGLIGNASSIQDALIHLVDSHTILKGVAK